MNNAVFFLMYNQTPAQLELTKEALASIQAQDIPVDILAVDNGSTDKTWEWLESTGVSCFRNPVNRSPVAVTNEWLSEMFGRMGYEHVLAIPNDVVVPRFLYKEFLKFPRGIVTGSMTADRNYDINQPVSVTATSENTPLCVALYRRWAYLALIAKDGYFFDPRYAHYCSDCDLALRISACGIRGVQLSLPYYHFGSGAHLLATPEEGDRMRREADADRAKFSDKWGFQVFDQQYSAAASDINFRG